MSLPAAFVHENEKADSLYSSHGPSAPELLGSPGGAHVQSRGVTRMEAMQRAARGSSGKVSLWIIIISLCICAWAYALDQSTTSSFNPFATSSFKDHSGGLSALSVATGIMSAVSKPFIAKIADITSRPYTYIFILAFYVVGYIIVACSPSLAAYVIGQVMRTIGSSGLNLLNSIIVADLTTLEWRGFVNAILSAPFLINVWFSGEIVNALGTSDKWRWGYGMFAIIMPACIGPAIVALVYLDRKAHKQGQIGLASSDAARRAALEATAEKGGHIPDNAVAAPPTALDQQRWLRTLKTSLIEIDAIGLILLGFAWSLILLPFSLQATAKGGWRNPSMIAMIVVGGIILILYGFYERFVAPMPSFPRRLVLNKTFMMAIIIDMFYFIAFYLEDLYLSSYTYIITPWSLRSWNYFSNTLTLSLCFFALIAGIIQRWTHRYKYLQTFGLCVKIIGIGILLNGSGATKSVASLIMSQILIGMGGSFSVIGSQVASQASVPHQDVAIAIAQLALWTYIGGSIGSAIAAPIWAAKMPSYLREFLPANITDEQVQAFYEDIRTIRDYNWDSPVRQGAVEAYRRTLYYLLVPALALAFIPLIASFFQTNYYLGKQQNAVTSVALDGSKLHESGSPSHDVPDASNLTFKQKFLRFWS